VHQFHTLSRLLIALCFLQFTHTAFATGNDTPYLLVIASQRNAETVAEAARLWAKDHPALAVKARTDAQLLARPDAGESLIRNSAAIIGMGLYGPVVDQLLPVLNARPGPQLLMHSDHRLIRLSRWQGAPVFPNEQRVVELAKSQPGTDFETWRVDIIQRFPAQRNWLEARAYWQAGGPENTRHLFSWMFAGLGAKIDIHPPKPTPRLRWLIDNKITTELPLLSPGNIVLLMEYAGGDRPADRALIRKICERIENMGNQCVTALAYWGKAGVEALEELSAQSEQTLKTRVSSVVMLQDFVIGGGEGREAVTQQLVKLNVPVLKAIKLRDRSVAQWHLSADGLAREKVYYQVAMPELQGASQPLVIATAGDESTDPLTGIRIHPVAPNEAGITSLIERLGRWQTLQSKPNAQKRIAIIYYNHPPGRHNIGADNLDVPASLLQILHTLKSAGYDTGELPSTAEALLDRLQQQGVNLPNDAKALANMSGHLQRADIKGYRQWFATLPRSIQEEMTYGPLGLMHTQLLNALDAGEKTIGLEVLEHTLEEIHHLLEGLAHPGRDRAVALIEKLEGCYHQAFGGGDMKCIETAPALIKGLTDTGIEGLGGWGEAPGQVMTYHDEVLLPGIQFGKVFIGPQPPRGWEINEELLHANLAFPPPHQYLAFYHFLKKTFKADALVHLGRHSTYEFLPRRSVGLAEDDYARVVSGDLPGVYPYIVDGVGEGIQAKRRGMAVMVDHLTPPLSATALYDELLQLRQLVESFEALHGSDSEAVASRLLSQIRTKVEELELVDELAQAMSAELAIMGIGFEDVDDDMLVHEIGHYLTNLQERFMPLGLHVYGRDWQPEATTMMLDSMAPADLEQRSQWHAQLKISPDAELTALLNGLNGGFIEPGQGNDPIRSPTSLPTGRNFYALDNSLIPSRVAWELGREMAEDARNNNSQRPDKREALILWASDVVRDEGVMIAFGLDMLGLKPVWNSRGIVTGLEKQDMTERAVRRDIVFTTSGLFRDLYAQQMMFLNRASLMALDASAETILREHPALTRSLQDTLSPLGRDATYGSEPLVINQVAAHWVRDTRALLAQGLDNTEAGIAASLRVFGDAPGSYGAGINRLAERSGAWESRSELADVYLKRIGHSYGTTGFGDPEQAAFRRVLSDVENTYFGRSSNLYGLIDNNDAFDYLGGLSLSIETLTGSAPNNFVIDHSNPKQVKAQPLGIALRQELRGRFLNPQWLKPLMAHGYAGARTMGSEFLEYLWGWQITNPTLVGDWAWEEVKAVYLDDRYELGLDDFLTEGHNVHVKTNMLAVMLVAIHKQFWSAEPETTTAIASEFTELVALHGLPGSGHTDPSHPMLPWLQQHLAPKQWESLTHQISQAKTDREAPREIHRVTELNLEKPTQPPSKQEAVTGKETGKTESANELRWLFVPLILIVMAGFYRALQRTREI